MAVGGPGDNVLFPKSGEKASQADCLQLIVFYPFVFCKATRPTSSLGVKEGDRGGDTQLGHWELGRSSLPIHAFIYCAFTECGTWHDPCIHVGDRRYTVMGL